MVDPEYQHIGRPPTKLIEECSEVIKAICKAERFGYQNHHPDRPDISNADEIETEIKDLIIALEEYRKWTPKSFMY